MIWPFSGNSDNKFVDDINHQILMAQAELNRMVFDMGRIDGQLLITQNTIKEYENRKKYLKSPENEVVDMFEYKHIRDQLGILYNNENVLTQHIENFQIAIGHAKKHIENLEISKEASRFKVLEFKKRGTG
jgi:predicted  nucleic acid-binding Zn-ribbon protein